MSVTETQFLLLNIHLNTNCIPEQLAFHIGTKVVFGFPFIDTQTCAVSIVSFHHTHKHGTRESEQAHAQVWRSFRNS